MLIAALLIAQTVITPPPSNRSSQADSYSYCAAYAQQQTGYTGAGPSNKSQNAPLRGAAAGAAGGAMIGGITGGNAGTGAAIGAGFGAIAGASRKNKAQKKAQEQENNYYNAMDACLSSRP